MPVERPLGVTDEVEVTIVRAVEPFKEVCSICGKTCENGCLEYLIIRACEGRSRLRERMWDE